MCKDILEILPGALAIAFVGVAIYNGIKQRQNRQGFFLPPGRGRQVPATRSFFPFPVPSMLSSARAVRYAGRFAAGLAVALHMGAAGSLAETIPVTGTFVATEPDTDPPVLLRAAVDGTTATLTFSEDVVSTDPGATGLLLSFLLYGILDGFVSVSPSALSIEGRTVTLTLGTGAKQGQTITVSYDVDFAGDSRLKDAAGNAVATFYDFAVTNETGEEQTPTETLPAVPVAPTVTGRSTSSANVDWSAPADNGSAITGYDLRYFLGGSDPASNDDWVGANHSGTATSTTLFCLAGDSAYRIQVRAVNAAGAGGWSESGAGSTLRPNAAPPGDTTAAASFSVEGDARVRIDVPSSDDVYHVLYYQPDRAAPNTEYAVAIHMGANGGVTLTEPLGIGAAGAYRVVTFSKDTPEDVDCDGTDDLAELARPQKTQRAPLNGAAPFDPVHGAVAIPDMETFRELSVVGTDAELGHLQGLEHVKFYVEFDGETPARSLRRRKPRQG